MASLDEIDVSLNITPNILEQIWKGTKLKSNDKVIGFYHQYDKPYGCFSNFYSNKQIIFTVPDFCWTEIMRSSGLPQSVPIDFSEKSIMLCKASLMGDPISYQMIIESSDPKHTKGLGRKIKPWNQQKWDKYVCEIAKEVVKQKFSQLDTERDVLFSTGDNILAEATKNDCIWGIGLDESNANINDPSKWRGKNILGWALMQFREELKN